jgi:hypothetical protein
MGKKFDLAVKVGTKQDGKAVWKNIGAMIEGEKGPYLLMDRTFNPAGVDSDGKGSILIGMFPPRAAQNNGGGNSGPY